MLYYEYVLELYYNYYIAQCLCMFCRTMLKPSADGKAIIGSTWTFGEANKMLSRNQPQ